MTDHQKIYDALRSARCEIESAIQVCREQKEGYVADRLVRMRGKITEDMNVATIMLDDPDRITEPYKRR